AASSPPAARGGAPAVRAPRRPRAWLRRLQLLTGVAVVVAASILVGWGLRRYLRSSQRFAIRTVVVSGNARRTPQEIAKRAGADIGKNIFAFDEQAAKAGVEADEWIESARVATELPSTVHVDVVEREAVALASIAGELLLVDRKGASFKALGAGDPSDLPVVTGIGTEEIARDRAQVQERLRRALDLCEDLERVGLAKNYPLQEIHLEPDDSITVVVGSQGVTLAFGQPPYRLKVDKAARVLFEVARRKGKPAVVFLDNEAHPERVVVRMQ
ncbi:MAG: FtsQ-type POTRA domain-containing protein, partial [Myxococcales bacterium]|nr:FtsQ-type POTRA domain-containing protein [Myxococcales bacterium]